MGWGDTYNNTKSWVGTQRDVLVGNVNANVAAFNQFRKSGQWSDYHAGKRAGDIELLAEKDALINQRRRQKLHEQFGVGGAGGQAGGAGAQTGGAQGGGIIESVVGAFYDEKSGIKWGNIAGIAGGAAAGWFMGGFIGGAAGGGWLGTVATVLLTVSGAVFGSQMIEYFTGGSSAAPAGGKVAHASASGTAKGVEASTTEVSPVDKIVDDALANAKKQFQDSTGTMSETGKVGYNALETVLNDVKTKDIYDSKIETEIRNLSKKQREHLENEFSKDKINDEERKALRIYEDTLSSVGDALPLRPTPPSDRTTSKGSGRE